MCISLRRIRLESMELRRGDGGTVQRKGVDITRCGHYVCVEMLRSAASLRVQNLCEERHGARS